MEGERISLEEIRALLKASVGVRFEKTGDAPVWVVHCPPAVQLFARTIGYTRWWEASMVVQYVRRPALLLLIVVCAASLQMRAEDISFRFQVKEKTDVFSWFPLQFGNRWFYKDTLRAQADQYARALDIQDSEPGAEMGFPIDGRKSVWQVSWLREVVVREHHRVPNGLSVLTEERVSGIGYSFPPSIQTEEKVGWLSGAREWGLPDPDKKVARQQFRRLIRGNAVYLLSPEDWDSARHSLASSFEHPERREPEYFFPLKSGLRWSDLKSEQDAYQRILARDAGSPPPGTFWFWVVKEQVPGQVFSLFHGVTKGGSNVLFKKGVGKTRVWQRSYFNGYIWHYTTELERFIPASSHRVK